MEDDKRRQKELRVGQRPGGIDVEDIEQEAPGDAGHAAWSTPDQRAVRELGHCLAAAGLLDLGLLLPTVCGDADGAAGILRAAAPQGYERYDDYAAGLLQFVLRPTPTCTGTSDTGSAAAIAETERQVTIFLDRVTESSLSTRPRAGLSETAADVSTN